MIEDLERCFNPSKLRSEIYELIKTVEELCLEVRELNDQKNYYLNMVVRYVEEVVRLKDGNFTEEEFQNLCHNMKVDGHIVTEEDVCRFKKNCEEYRNKLFQGKTACN